MFTVKAESESKKCNGKKKERKKRPGSINKKTKKKKIHDNILQKKRPCLFSKHIGQNISLSYVYPTDPNILGPTQTV